jgi:mannose-6-phosphate isomerase
MLQKIGNVARDYAWGSRTLISDYFGLPQSQLPMAEIWYGTHPGSPAFLVDEPNKSLSEALGGKQLSFLLKILAADAPLSIQAHPNAEQARLGFEAENAAGVSLNSSARNYKDDQHKPEVIVALTEFRALCGFKPLQQIEFFLADLAEHPAVSDGFRSMSKRWLDLLAEPNGLQKVFSDILHRGGNLDGYNAELAALAENEAQFGLAEELNLQYPGDPGVVVAMLMNQVYLEPGQALFLPAGNIHAYLGGLGVEVMASSDNVLRGGLTTKHLDIDELEKVVDFVAGELPLVKPIEIANGLTSYPCEVDEFMLYRAELDGTVVLADLNLAGDCVALCTAGEISISSSLDERIVIKRGEAAFLSADAKLFSLAGAGTAYLALGSVR